jgi:hypothetical protein
MNTNRGYVDRGFAGVTSVSKEYTRSSKVEQLVAVKFVVTLNKTPTECFRMLTEAYGADCMSRARVF